MSAHHPSSSHHYHHHHHHHHSVGSGLQHHGGGGGGGGPVLHHHQASSVHHNSHGGSLSNGVGGGGGRMAGDTLPAGGGRGGKFSSSASTVSAASSVASSSVTSNGVHHHGKSPSIASLCNLGNTCFLNSVLYTLRFTPGFLHNLHHMVGDLNGQQAGNGPSPANSTSSSSSSSSSAAAGKKKKAGGGTLSNGSLQVDSSASSDTASDADMAQDVIEHLHDLFKTLSCSDEARVAQNSSSSHNGTSSSSSSSSSSNGVTSSHHGRNGSNGSSSGSSSCDPIPPSSFLTAVGKLNPMFEGNQQQDAHELLVMILNILEDVKIPASARRTTPSPSLGTEDSIASLPPPVPEKRGRGKKGAAAKQAVANGGHQVMVNGVDRAPSQMSNREETVSKSTEDRSKQLAKQEEEQWMPNFVKDNFEGKQVMRTRCLECELSTYRSEKFTNIDVPIHLEEPDDVDELSGPDLFLKQILMSETLRENNKYWCEECGRLNEAQRSVQFEVLPRVMVLQLKRFTSASGASKASFVSKINDYIPTPFAMDCFCSRCMDAAAAEAAAAEGAPPPRTGGRQRHQQQSVPPQPRHHYRLYAVIMHLGATLASGHYIAFVRASQAASSRDYGQCPRRVAASKNKKALDSSAGNIHHLNGVAGGKGSSNSSSSEKGGKSKDKKDKGIMKFLRRHNDKNNSASISSASTPSLNGHATDSRSSNGGGGPSSLSSSDLRSSSPAAEVLLPCPGARCCGIRAPLVEGQQQHPRQHQSHPNRPSSAAAGPQSSSSMVNGSSVPHQRSLDGDGGNIADGCEVDGPSSSSSSAADLWLECDDESIQVITRKQLEGILSAKQGATTPYLLFYQRL